MNKQQVYKMPSQTTFPRLRRKNSKLDSRKRTKTKKLIAGGSQNDSVSYTKMNYPSWFLPYINQTSSQVEKTCPDWWTRRRDPFARKPKIAKPKVTNLKLPTITQNKSSYNSICFDDKKRSERQKLTKGWTVGGKTIKYKHSDCYITCPSPPNNDNILCGHDNNPS